MNKSTNSAASALLALSLTGLLLAVGQAQAGGQRPRTAPTSVSEQAGALGGRVGLRQPMSAEEKLIRNAYVKLMRYHSASLDEAAATSKKEIQPDDYLRFELRDIHTGPIEEISEKPLSEFVTPPGGDIVIVKPNHRVWGNGPAHAYYEAEWAGASDAQQTGESATVEETLRSGGEKLLGVEKYTIYQVSVRLGGKQRIYRAIALHHGKSETGKKGSEIIDNITSELNTVLAEESPRVRSPWNTYVKTSLYLEVSREIRDQLKEGLPLIPPDAPIGYLPGDDVELKEQGSQMTVAVVCAGPHLDSISPARGLQGIAYNVTIRGTGFRVPASVSVAGTGIAVSEVVVGSSTEILAAFTIAANADGGKHAVTVKVNNQPSDNKVNFYVQIPTKLRRDSITALQNQQGGCGASKTLEYTLLDQAGEVIAEDLTVDEVFSNFTSNPPGFPPPGEQHPAANAGHLVDTVGYRIPTCPPPFTVSLTQNFTVKVGQTVYNLTTTNSVSYGRDTSGNKFVTVTNTVP